MDSESNIMVPGDEVTHLLTTKMKGKIILGPGLRRVADKVFACNGGIFKKKQPNTFWINSHRKRYIPVRNEYVIGIIVNKQGDYFKVDIGSSEQALLSYLAFEGATKKNRVKLEIGDVIFGKLLTAYRDMEPEIVCINSLGKSDIMGILSNDGYLFHCNIDLVKKLYNKECPIDKLGSHFKYEIVIGMNGRIWLKTENILHAISISKLVLACEFLTYNEIEALCDNFIKKNSKNKNLLL